MKAYKSYFKENFITLYHGTSKNNFFNKFNTKYVYLTPNKEMAFDYGEKVLKIIVPKNKLLIDMDHNVPLSLETANALNHTPDYTIDDYINKGQSMAILSKYVKL
jgi:hypothetical protein